MNTAKKLLHVSLALSAAATFAAPIRESIEGQPPVEVAGKSLPLNGVGRYNRMVWPVYKVYLYLETRSSDADAIIKSNELKFARMVFLRDIEAQEIRDAWTEEFTDQCDKLCDKLRPELDKLLKVVPDMKKDEAFKFTYLTDKLTIEKPDAGTVEIPGSEFGRVMLSTWLGNNPPSETFRKGLLNLL